MTRAEKIHRRMELMAYFANRLKSLRLKKKWTQAKLSEVSNVNARCISYYEHSYILPLPLNLFRLSNALKVNNSYSLEEIK